MNRLFIHTRVQWDMWQLCSVWIILHGEGLSYILQDVHSSRPLTTASQKRPLTAVTLENAPIEVQTAPQETEKPGWSPTSPGETEAKEGADSCRV